jgi:hypothetical protein
MRFRNPSLTPAELVARRACGHADQIEKDWRTLFGSTATYPQDAIRSALTPVLAKYPAREATRDEVAIHEAGHFVLFERMGMGAAQARIFGPAGGRGAWTGTAGAWGRADRQWVTKANTWGHEPLWGEAIAALGGPFAEALLGRGDAFGSLGELVAATLWAVRVAKLTGEPWEAAVLKAVIEAIYLVELLAPEIREVGEELARRRRIGSEQSIKKILACQ